MKIFTKKNISIVFACLCFATAHAYDVFIGGIYYNLNNDDKTAEVTYGFYEYPDSVSIPENITDEGVSYSVTSIGGSAFRYSTYLTSITIPNSVTSIGNLAFSGCKGLTSIIIPYSVTSIASAVFAECSGLESITVASDNETYDSRDNCNAIIEKSTNTLIAGCKNTVIPNTVTGIGNSAFYKCSSLTSLTIPNSVTSIGDHAFYECTSLTSFTIPNSVTSIGDWAFYFCPGLTSVTIPNSVTSIGNYAFDGCFGLTSIIIPYSVTSIASAVFAECSGLESITVASDNETYDSRDNCNAIIEKSTNTLIAGCKNTIIPNSVTSIGDHAFYKCSNLTSLTIPNSVTSIGNEAFSYCYGLTSITIGNSVTSIGDSTFCACTGLTSVTIPESVTSIGMWAFAYCYSLNSITSLAVTPPTCSSLSFDGIDKQACILNVPEESVELYKAADGWKDFGSIVEYVSGIDNAAIDAAPEIFVKDGAIYVGGCHETTAVEVYDTNGKCVRNATGSVISGLPHGLYIVKAGKLQKKIFL